MDRVQAARYPWLCTRLALSAGAGEAIKRLIGADDNLKTTEHVVALKGDQLVGAVTLRFSREGTATDFGHGFELEHQFRLRNSEGLRLVEVSRLCTDPKDNGAAFLTLKRGMESLAKARNIDGWVALPDCGTDSEMRVKRIYEVVQELGLSFTHTCTNPASSAARLDRSERRNLLRSLPPTLQLFPRFFSARVIGPPMLHPAFPRFVIPVFAPVGPTNQFPTATPKNKEVVTDE